MYGNNIGPLAYSKYLNISRYESHVQPSHLGYDIPQEYQHLIHEHWRNYSAPSFTERLIFYIIYATLMCVSAFGNGLVILIFSTSKPLRTPSNMLIINLAVFDMIMWANFPLTLVNDTQGYMVGGDLGCIIFALTGSISGIGASFSNALIAYDRYRTISNPIDGRLSYMQIWFLITLSWIWAMPFTVLPTFKIWGRFIPEGYLTISTFDYLTDSLENRYFIWSICTWACIIPLITIITNYTRLFFHVRGHERMLAEQAKKMNVKSLSANNNNDMSIELRIAKAAIYIWFLFILAWMPYTMVALLSTFGYRHLITPFVSMLPAAACKTVSCLDPWVYAASHPKYRAELERRVPWLGIRERNHQASSASTASTTGNDSGTIVME